MYQFTYHRPDSLSAAVAQLAGDGDAKALAGGQSLVPMMAFRVAQPSLLVDLRKLPDLDRIDIAADGVRLGAAQRDVADDPRRAAAIDNRQ